MRPGRPVSNVETGRHPIPFDLPEDEMPLVNVKLIDDVFTSGQRRSWQDVRPRSAAPPAVWLTRRDDLA